MAKSLNTKVDIVEEGISYHGLTSYGKIMVGDQGFEFYNNRNVEDYIQIPWNEIDYVIASVLHVGKKITRYAIRTKRNGDYSFSSKNSINVLRTVRLYIPENRMVQSLNIVQVIKRRVKYIISGKE